MENLNKSFDRIKDINWDDRADDKYSYRILINEFISRGNIFRDMFGNWGDVRIAIFSAAKTLNLFIPDDIQALIDENSKMKCGWTMKLVCKFYFEWSYLIDIENEVAIKYSELYEPVIKLFERGGRLSYNQSELICGPLGWPRICDSLPRKVFINEISDEILDNIDLEYK